MLPRGIRNNNPLNIRIGNKWVGEVEKPTDKDFEQFTSMVYGLRAGYKLIRRYIERYHLCTVKEILSRWAPTTENNTQSYVSFVCERSGIGALETLSFGDENKMVALVEAMCVFENGQKVSLDDIWRAYLIVKSALKP